MSHLTVHIGVAVTLISELLLYDASVNTTVKIKRSSSFVSSVNSTFSLINGTVKDFAPSLVKSTSVPVYV